jgi:hypothetical protein
MYEDDDTATDSTEEALLKELRDRYSYAVEKWRESRKEAQIDRRYLSGDPWDPAERKARANRPCVSHDELNQYVNRAINNALQSKRGIKIEPEGDATEKAAELRQDIIRTVEYQSNGPNAYMTAYESCLQSSYGFFRIGRRYVANDNLTPENFNQQEIKIGNIANADSVIFDPDCKEADWSDARYVFVLDPITREEFKLRYPDAQIRDFSADEIRLAGDWVNERNVLLAEYWKVEVKETTQYLLNNGTISDKAPKGEKPKSKRKVQKRSVIQYITNGVEILATNPQPGTIVPIVPVMGPELYLDDGSGPKRVLFSLPRLARDPQMTLAFLCSQEMEEASLTPKSPYMVYVGQTESDSGSWENLTKVPVAYVKVDPIVDGATGQVLPLPRREQFNPNFQQYELAKDGARRAIQAAMGISALPTAAQRNNEKSGVALQKIEQQQDIGSYHFLDNFMQALRLAGRIMNEWIPVVYGGDERQMNLRMANEKTKRAKLNTEAPYPNEQTGEEEHYPIDDDGTHSVTVSTGPSDQSQREAAEDFLDTLISNLKNLPIPPPQMARLLAIAIRMKQLGPKGDEMAEIISPQDQQNIPPQMQAAMQQAQQEMQQIHAYAQSLEVKINALEQEKMAKVVDNTFKMQIEQMKEEAATARAEITTKAQSIEERLAFVEDTWKQLHSQAHDAGMQAQDQQHQQGMAEQAQAAQAQQAQQQQEAPA